MDWEHLLSTYGYLAVLVGTFLEGESILVAGGIAAHEGYLQLPWVIAAAFIGSFTGDQLFFFIGRLQGRKLLAKHPKWNARVNRVHKLMERWHTIFILGFRFLYGLRTLSPFVLGTSDVPTRRFFFLNMIGAAVWAIAIGGMGYIFGSVIELFIGRAKHYQLPILIGVAIVLGIFSIAMHIRSGRNNIPPAL